MLTRRTIKTRDRLAAKRLAGALKKMGVKPNAVSVLSLVFAVAAGVCLVNTLSVVTDVAYFGLFVAAAFFIQLRLLCNMLDGMLAVEEKLSTKLGDLFNEIPDRLADVIILLCAGYAIPSCHGEGVTLGWIAALLAVFTAYIRLLGTSLGTRAYFSGPMAKPHRMFVLTVGCFFGTIGIFYALIIIVLGSLVTVLRRTALISKEIMTK